MEETGGGRRMIELENASKEQIEDLLDDITFHNIILWRKDELKRILGGEKPIDVIPQSNQRRKLYRDGILISTYQRAGRVIKLTPKAKKLLEDMI